MSKEQNEWIKCLSPGDIRDFCERIGVAKRDAVTDYNLLEFCVLEALNQSVQRRIRVLRPLIVILTNYDKATTEFITLENLPVEEAKGSREVPFRKELWIEQDDFTKHPIQHFLTIH